MNDMTWTVAQIREAEQVLMERESYPDELMQSAAEAIADVAHAMAWDQPADAESASYRILILAGPGGNGGDGLYAGARLAMDGHDVTAYLTAGTAHTRALQAFRKAGGRVLDAAPDMIWEYHIAIDAITGIGGTAGLREEFADLVEDLKYPKLRVLSVDVPSGIAADTGEGGDLHVTADATVTFGGWRRAHVLNPACGDQLCVDIAVGDTTLGQVLGTMSDEGELGEALMVFASRAVNGDFAYTEYAHPLPTLMADSIEPGPNDDKYSGGVVGIRAGSDAYPGAPILCTTAAFNATPAMVRYAGPQALEVVRANPEVVATDTLDRAGRVQAWAFGPGTGTDDSAAAELQWLLEQEEPLLIDADGISLLATHPNLRHLLTQRSSPTVITPHDGEFARLADVVCPDGPSDRLQQTQLLAAELGCFVVRKGRVTLICPSVPDDYCFAVDAGHSWAATPGSGDVLTGLIGARLARAAAQTDSEELADAMAETLAQCVTIHALAAHLAAMTPFGYATAPATRIADFIRAATADLT